MERNYAIDFIKTISILAVVTIHISTAFLDRTLPFTLQFDILLLINQFSRFAVPLFFASSGFLLASKYNRPFHVFQFYKKRVIRIFPSYLFWVFIYFFIVFQHPDVSIVSFKFLNSIFTGDASYQLYFIPGIILLYLSFPFFIKFKNIFLSNIFLYSLTAIMLIVLTFVYYADFKIPLSSPFKTALYNLLPFLVGVYTATNKERVKFIGEKYNVAILLLTFLSGFVIFAESFYLYRHFNELRFLREQWRISVTTYGILCGWLFKKVYEKFLLTKKVIIFTLSKLSFGVFFIHVAVLKYFQEYIIDPFDFYNILGFIITLAGVLIISFLGIYLSSKIPKIGKIISAS